MAADIHHIFSKGQGIFVNLAGGSYPHGKLRLAFECGPFAFLAEQAGGASSDGTSSILKKTITSVDERTPFLVGSSDEVARCNKILKKTEK